MKPRNILSYLILCLTLVAVSSCNKKETEDAEIYNPVTQGRVCFELVRHNVYLMSDLTEARTIKMTIRNAQGETISLPSMPLHGNEDLISTDYVPLQAGSYTVMGYRCFDLQGDLLEDLDITLTRDNRFEVKAGMDMAFSLPVDVKRVLTTSNLYNTLRGICLEILGEDESRWPKSWDFESGEIDINWAGLEFDTDANSNPTDVIGLIIDGKPQYIINSDTWEQQLVSLQEFRDMTVLPGCIANLTGLQSLVVRNCQLEKIPAEMQYATITSLAIEDTPLSQIPEDLGQLKNLTDLSLRSNHFTTFPECMTNVRTLEIFDLRDEDIDEVPASIAQWADHLISLTVSGTQISSFPDVFDRLWHVSTLDLSRNPRLCQLPASVGLEKIPYGSDGRYSYSALTGLILNDCAFTTIPAPAQRAGIRSLNMANNKITEVTADQLEAMSDLETLVLDGNPLSSFPRITNPRLQMLSLIGTGLAREQVDLTGLPNLNPRYVFFTQQEYDAIFK